MFYDAQDSTWREPDIKLRRDPEPHSPDHSGTTYPDSAHGFLFQHAALFAADVDSFSARRQTTEKERLP
jgi:hypothetical protein